MSEHNLPEKLLNAHFPGTFKGMYVVGSGYYRGWGTTVGSDAVGGAAVEGWAKGALYVDTDASAGAQLWINVGTSATASWKAVTDLSAANTWAALQTFTTGAAITAADGLTVNSVIVPTTLEIPVPLIPHASVATRALFYATQAWTVTGLTYEPFVAEGTGSVVCTVCKVTGNNIAVAATTPMCTAFAVTGTAGTPVVATLTGTAADLVLAATNKIGCIFSGGDSLLDSGGGILTIKMKRS